MALARKGLTLEEFLALPEEKPALEYADGVVTQKVAPKSRHSILQVAFVALLLPLQQARIARVFTDVAEPLAVLAGALPLQQARIARVFTELRTTFAGRSYVPDVALIRWERVPRTPTGQPEDDVRVPPDLAIEIVSPGESVRELQAKCRWYAENGVAAALFVNYRDESIRVFRPGRATATWRGSGRIALSDVAPGLVVVVEDVFGALHLD